MIVLKHELDKSIHFDKIKHGLLVIEGGITDSKMKSRQEDLHVARQIAKGNEREMKKVYDAYSGSLFQFVKSWLADPHMASDIVHETMLEVWRRADRFQGRSSLKSWIYSIARNKSIDFNRKQSRLTYTDQFEDEIDLEASPREALAKAEVVNTIKTAVSKLSETHRRMIHLAFYEDLTYQEIAEIEDCPVGTVKTRIMHAKKLLMRDLASIK